MISRFINKLKNIKDWLNVKLYVYTIFYLLEEKLYFKEVKKYIYKDNIDLLEETKYSYYSQQHLFKKYKKLYKRLMFEFMYKHYNENYNISYPIEFEEYKVLDTISYKSKVDIDLKSLNLTFKMIRDVHVYIAELTKSDNALFEILLDETFKTKETKDLKDVLQDLLILPSKQKRLDKITENLNESSKVILDKLILDLKEKYVVERL